MTQLTDAAKKYKDANSQLTKRVKELEDKNSDGDSDLAGENASLTKEIATLREELNKLKNSTHPVVKTAPIPPKKPIKAARTVSSADDSKQMKPRPKSQQYTIAPSLLDEEKARPKKKKKIIGWRR